jgi:hypothetical protein
MSKEIGMTDWNGLATLAKRKLGKIEAMSEEERRAYNAQAAREARARRKETRQTGDGKPTVAITRDLLADIAIAMLSNESAGSREIMEALRDHFADRTGFPIKIRADAKKGKLKPKVLKT